MDRKQLSLETVVREIIVTTLNVKIIFIVNAVIVVMTCVTDQIQK